MTGPQCRILRAGGGGRESTLYPDVLNNETDTVGNRDI